MGAASARPRHASSRTVLEDLPHALVSGADAAVDPVRAALTRQSVAGAHASEEVLVASPAGDRVVAAQPEDPIVPPAGGNEVRSLGAATPRRSNRTTQQALRAAVELGSSMLVPTSMANWYFSIS